MMDSAESCVPPGFRFHPTDEELVGYYLRKKVASQKIDLDVIRDIDLYRIEPWDLQDKCRIGYEEQNEWYFFSHKDKKYPTGTRTNRATIAGFWKATGRDKSVYERAKLIGMRKTLVFYKGRAPNGQKTDWIMHEYRLESDENGPPQEEGWVVCRAFKKKATGQTKSNIINETWDSSYFYEDQASAVNSVVDPLDFITRQNHHQSTYLSQNNFLCKREIEQAETLNRLLNSTTNSDPIFVHDLPQLESPSLPLPKMPISAISLEKNKMVEEDHHQELARSSCYSQKVTDWRDLDKFVASQLSHDHQGDAVSTSAAGFEAHHHDDQDDSSDLGYLLFQNGRDQEGSKLSGFLSSSSDCDIGICVFDK